MSDGFYIGHSALERLSSAFKGEADDRTLLPVGPTRAEQQTVLPMEPQTRAERTELLERATVAATRRRLTGEPMPRA